MNDLLLNLEKLHTTPLGIERIKKNLKIDVPDVVQYCVQKIQKAEALIEHKGKNWYIQIDNTILTVNAHSYTIITAHKKKA